MVSGFKECIEKELLKRIPPSEENCTRSLNKAKKWLEEAEKSFENKIYQSSVLSSYLAMFHSARAILFRDGYREKSHYCVARYLEEKYVKTGKLERKWVELLDYYREMRHNNQYDLSFFVSEKEAKNSLISAREFFERMEKLIYEK